MGALAYLQLLLTHPNEFRTLVQFKLYHEYRRDITAKKEHPTSGWDRETMRRCWAFLDQTSRSFSAVIKELEGDLARAICLFYLVLRGLDTIEDDMTIPNNLKQPLLRKFHIHTQTPGWTFNDSGPNEKDRQLLVEYDVVVTELFLLEPGYRDVILDICEKMATGMADYSNKAAQNKGGEIYLDTVAEYDLYCHYVAGLVGEGLSGIFSASGKEAGWLKDQLELSNSMGLLLQKTNIIRDYREDVEEKRYFWPREIWGSEITPDPTTGKPFSHLSSLYSPTSLDTRTSIWVQSGMVLNAMSHLPDALTYLRLLKNQSVFNFCAIPATMAIATLELCFMNPEMFKRNIKIRKAQAASLIMRSTNPREVSMIFRDYARRIHRKAVPEDPYYVRISIACGKVEAWCEQHYPSFVVLPTSGSTGGIQFDPSDARTRLVLKQKEYDSALVEKRRLQNLANGVKEARDLLPVPPAPSETAAMKEIAFYIVVAFVCIFGVCGLVVWMVLHFGQE